MLSYLPASSDLSVMAEKIFMDTMKKYGVGLLVLNAYYQVTTPEY